MFYVHKANIYCWKKREKGREKGSTTESKRDETGADSKRNKAEQKHKKNVTERSAEEKKEKKQNERILFPTSTPSWSSKFHWEGNDSEANKHCTKRERSVGILWKGRGRACGHHNPENWETQTHALEKDIAPLHGGQCSSIASLMEEQANKERETGDTTDTRKCRNNSQEFINACNPLFRDRHSQTCWMMNNVDKNWQVHCRCRSERN